MFIFSNNIKNLTQRTILIIFFSCLLSVLFIIPIYASSMEDVINSDTAKTPFTIKKTIYHKHTGSSNGGGCYGKHCTGTRTVEVECGGSMVYWPETDSSQCDRCGAGYHGDESGRKCWHSTTEEESYSYYDLNCGKSTNDIVGTVSLTKSEEEWTTSLTLTASYENFSMKVNEIPFLYNGNQTEQSAFSVSENGIYSLQLCADENANTQSAAISMDIRNIDKWAPVIKGYSLLPEDWTNKGVNFEVLEVVDLQPDGTDGCGLHEFPYSYDNGDSWTSENTFLYKDNGTYTVMVRDKLGNTSEITFEISNIDCLGPLTEVDYDHTKNIAKTTLSITAKDIMEDGRDGSGLHEFPYSYDGGKTWTVNSTLEVQKNGTIAIAVRDRLENVTFLDVTITNIDATPPKVWHMLYPGYWTNKSVKAFFFAEDLQENGEEGIGLSTECFSFDSGESWTSDNEMDMNENGEIHVVVKDKHGNKNYYSIEITNIDKICPTVRLNLLQDSEGKSDVLVLQALASDSQSGIADNGYSWDGGITFGSAKTLRVSENGSYTVSVKDRAGNITTVSLEVTGIQKKIFSEITDTLNKITNKKSNEMDSSSAKKKTISPKINKSSGRPISINEVSPKKIGIKEIIFLVCAGLIIFCTILFFLIMQYRSVSIYNETDKECFQFLGRQWIRQRDGKFEVIISNVIWSQCNTTHFRFKFSELFIILHRNEDIFFFFPEEHCECEKIDKMIEIDICAIR